MKFQPKSLQQRTLLYILVPTFFLLITLSLIGFIVLRDMLLDQWGSVAISRLQRSAHLIDMELKKPKELIVMLQQDERPDVVSEEVFAWVLGQIERLDVVVAVNVVWPDGANSSLAMSRKGMWRMMEKVKRYRMEHNDIGSPEYNSEHNNRTVTLVSKFKNLEERLLGRVEVLVAFDKLMGRLVNAPWWKSYKAYLLDAQGNVLISTGDKMGLEDAYPMRAFGTMSTLEQDTLDAIQQSEFGIVWGQRFPPDEISGYYHLTEVPWTLVVIAPGHDVLKPIIQFRFHYFVALAFVIGLILFFIRRSINRVTLRIKELSTAAEKLARGSFGPPLQVKGIDEVEELTRNFNMMSHQLHQRLMMKEAIHIAREIQQNLLPAEDYNGQGLSVSGKSIYCDETGGDYLDILYLDEQQRRVAVVVGDVVGHGIGAALLMASVRSLLRGRLCLQGSPEQVMTDVNRQLYHDTVRSGNFVTLMYVEIDQETRTLSWVRAGHDPAIVYTPSSGRFTELKGNGIALGVDSDWIFERNERPAGDEQQLILLCSDGVWEVENIDGEFFGKKRLQQILAECHANSPQEIVQAILRAIAEFKEDVQQSDDITLAVIKIP